MAISTNRLARAAGVCARTVNAAQRAGRLPPRPAGGWADDAREDLLRRMAEHRKAGRQRRIANLTLRWEGWRERNGIGPDEELVERITPYVIVENCVIRDCDFVFER